MAKRKAIRRVSLKKALAIHHRNKQKRREQVKKKPRGWHQSNRATGTPLYTFLYTTPAECATSETSAECAFINLQKPRDRF
jgi:hypothetical protein